MNATATLDHAVASALAGAMRDDPDLVLLAEGEHPQHARLHEADLAGRIELVPMMDRGVLGMAVGMAIGGRAVVVELSVASRLWATIEVLAEAAALPRELLGRPVVVRVPWGREAGALDGPVLGVLAAIEGLRVVAAASPGAAASLLHAALGRPGVTVLLEPRALGRGAAEDPVSATQARVVSSGDDVVLVAAGADVAIAEAASEALAAEGVSAGVVDLVSLHPVDADGLAQAVRAAGRLVVIAAEGESSWAAGVREAVTTTAFLYLEAPPAVAPPEVGDVVAIARAAIRY